MRGPPRGPPGGLQEAFKRPPEREASKRPPRGPQEAPGGPQEAPGGPPRGPEEAPRGSQEAPKRLPRGQSHPQLALRKPLFGLLVVFPESLQKSLGGVRFCLILGDFCRPRGGPLGSPGDPPGAHPDCEKSRISACRALARPPLREAIFSNFGLFWSLFGLEDQK